MEIVNKEIANLEALKQINGFGKKKIEKYGKEIPGIIDAFFRERIAYHASGNILEPAY